MNESLTPQELDVMAHAAGWDARRKKDRLYRNYFSAEEGHHDWHTLSCLCERGLMRRGRSIGGTVFAVTEAGIALLRRFRP